MNIEEAKAAKATASQELEKVRAALDELDHRMMGARARKAEAAEEITSRWMTVLLDGANEGEIARLRAEAADAERTLAELPSVRRELEKEQEEALRRLSRTQNAIDQVQAGAKYQALCREYAHRGQLLVATEERELMALGNPLGHRKEIEQLVKSLRHHCSVVGLNRRGEPMQWPAGN